MKNFRYLLLAGRLPLTKPSLSNRQQGVLTQQEEFHLKLGSFVTLRSFWLHRIGRGSGSVGWHLARFCISRILFARFSLYYVMLISRSNCGNLWAAAPVIHRLWLHFYFGSSALLTIRQKSCGMLVFSLLIIWFARIRLVVFTGSAEIF